MFNLTLHYQKRQKKEAKNDRRKKPKMTEESSQK
jgi:hypothetical protein